MKILEIAGRKVGSDHPCFIVAELGANAKTFEHARQLVCEAAEAGADAVKCQTMNPAAITLDCDKEPFWITWRGERRKLFDLYRECAMPWEWQPPLKELAESLGLVWFSTPFDEGAVDFLDSMSVPCFKVASFEIVDRGLISHMAGKGKPVILSTGMATESEIREAVAVCRDRGNYQVALLKCTSAYPAKAEDANLLTILSMANHFDVPAVGLSDHSLSPIVPVVAVTLGANIVEKHITLSRQLDTPDAAFSLEPEEFRDMVRAVRTAEAAIGEVRFGPSEQEKPMLAYRRSLFVVQDLQAGDMLTRDNVQSIRPAGGLHPRYLPHVLGERASRPIERGTPLSWEHLA